MPEITVIADDLTGAADCGIAFALAGLPTFVAFSARVTPPPSAQVVAVDTDSRAASATEAAARVRAAAEAAWSGGARTLYKKIDSTLRGHVGVEVAAALAAGRESGRRAAGLSVAKADLAAVRAQKLPRGADAIVCDADQEDDLRHVADAVLRLDAPILW